jgi:hypothetical protein
MRYAALLPRWVRELYCPTTYFEKATRRHKPQGCVVHSQGCENSQTSPDRYGQARILLGSRIRVPWTVRACNRGLSIFNTIFRNVGNYLPGNIVSHPKKLESSTSNITRNLLVMAPLWDLYFCRLSKTTVTLAVVAQGTVRYLWPVTYIFQFTIHWVEVSCVLCVWIIFILCRVVSC